MKNKRQQEEDQNLREPRSKISYSEFKTFQECPYKHKLSYIDEVAKFEGNEYTAFGTSMHHVCEQVVQDQQLGVQDLSDLFINKLLEEVLSLTEKSIDLDKNLLREMKDQGKVLLDKILPALESAFGDFEVVSVEEMLYEDMSLVDLRDMNFKGYVDLVIKTPDDKYHIIDWKTCSWGWNMKKKTDRLVTYQLTYYKTFFAQKHNIPSSQIETHFALLKRTARKDQVEIFRVTSGERKVNNSLKLLQKTVKSINKGTSFKNRLSCRYCNFHNTEHCT